MLDKDTSDFLLSCKQTHIGVSKAQHMVFWQAGGGGARISNKYIITMCPTRTYIYKFKREPCLLIPNTLLYPIWVLRRSSQKSKYKYKSHLVGYQLTHTLTNCCTVVWFFHCQFCLCDDGGRKIWSPQGMIGKWSCLQFLSGSLSWGTTIAPFLRLCW